MRVFFLISTFSLILGGTASAADLGQYRPGNPYQSVIAPGADVCESHCNGDAQCRSWNYVKASPQASGVCEFNANDVPPVASAISISGSSTSEVYRPGVVPGGTNTIRVGTAPSVQNQPSVQPQTQTSPTRRIVREPVPQQTQIQSASTGRRTVTSAQPGSLTDQQNQNRRMTGPRAIDPRAKGQMPQNPGVQNGQTVMPQRFKYDLGGQPSVNQRPEPQQGYGQNQMSAPMTQNSRPQPYPPQTYRPQNYAPQYQPAQPAPQQGQVTRTERRRHQGPTMTTAPLQQETPSRAQPYPGQGLQGQTYQGQNYPEQAYQAQGQGQAFPPQGNYTSPNTAQYAAQNAPMPRRSATDPLTYGDVASTQMSGAQMAGTQMSGEQNSGQAPYPNRAQSQAFSQGLSAEQAQQSLFGKLNDNVQVPNSGGAVPTNPNAPIPTMTSRASGRVEQSNLAGGPY